MNQHKKGHPIIVSYKKTQSKKFNLILVIGREPNNNVKIINKVGQYDFDKSPFCAFWNISYKLIGSIINLSVKEIKEKCRQKKSSVILFADALPKPILNKIHSKNKIRRISYMEEIEDHINKIFEKSIIKRVKLILLSGLGDSVFKHSKEQIKLFAKKRQIKISEVPFFYPSNFKKIILDKEDEEKIKQIYFSWTSIN